MHGVHSEEMLRYFYLTPVLGGPGAPRYPIADQPQMVGRSEGADIPLLEPTVSREHASIHQRGGHVYLEDLGSKHGTFVNSKRVNAARLKVGDIIVFGLSLVLRLEESDEELPPAPELGPGGPDSTVSILEPVAVDPRATAASAGGRPPSRQQMTAVSLRPSRSASEEVARVREIEVKLRKLATLGARLALEVPRVRDRLRRISADVRDGGDSGSQLTDALDDIAEQLDAAISDLALSPPVLAPTNLFDLVRRATAAVLPQAKPRNVVLLVGVSAEVEVNTDANRLQTALVDLLRSMTEAARSGAEIELTARSDRQLVRLLAIDASRSIAPGVIERALGAFASPREDWEAIGLGLFSARQAIAWLHGDLTARADERGALVVEISLPTAS